MICPLPLRVHIDDWRLLFKSDLSKVTVRQWDCLDYMFPVSSTLKATSYSETLRKDSVISVVLIVVPVTAEVLSRDAMKNIHTTLSVKYNESSYWDSHKASSREQWDHSVKKSTPNRKCKLVPLCAVMITYANFLPLPFLKTHNSPLPQSSASPFSKPFPLVNMATPYDCNKKDFLPQAAVVVASGEKNMNRVRRSWGSPSTVGPCPVSASLPQPLFECDAIGLPILIWADKRQLRGAEERDQQLRLADDWTRVSFVSPFASRFYTLAPSISPFGCCHTDNSGTRFRTVCLTESGGRGGIAQGLQMEPWGGLSPALPPLHLS